MPWHVSKSGQCPASKPYAVIKDSDGSIAGCHPSEKAANAQMAALYAQEAEPMSKNAVTVEAGPVVDATVESIRVFDARVIYAPLDACEWRDSGDPDKPNETTLRGHAAIFNSLSDDLGGFRELIAPGFFRAALRKQPDVRLLFNHDPNYVMGRTAAGTLELREDNRGLHVFARVDKTIGWVNDLRTSMQRGDVDQMSFAFTVREGGDDWAVVEEDAVVRTLLPDGADQLYDVSVVTYPAYKATEVSMRSLLEEAIESGRLPERVGATPGITPGIAEQPKLVPVVRGVVEGVEEQRDHTLETLARYAPDLASDIRQGMDMGEEPDDIDYLLCAIGALSDFLDTEEDPDGQDRVRAIITEVVALLSEEFSEEPDEVQAASHVDALAELRTDTRDTLRAEKEQYLRLLKEITR